VFILASDLDVREIADRACTKSQTNEDYAVASFAPRLRLGEEAGATKDKVLQTLVNPTLRVARLPPTLMDPPGAEISRLLVDENQDGSQKGVSEGTSNPIAPHQKVHVEFNPRAGIVSVLDGEVLFINVMQHNPTARYPNTFSLDGQRLSFFLRSNLWGEGDTTLAKRLLSAGTGSSSDDSEASSAPKENHRILLFARNGLKKTSSFVFCGRCAARRPVADGEPERRGGSDLIELELELLDFEELKASLSPSFAALVAIQSSQQTDGEEKQPKPPSESRAGRRRAKSDTTNGDGYGEYQKEIFDCFEEDSDALQARLASLVNSGDVIGALSLALDSKGTRASRRSLETGVACLKVLLARSDDPAVLMAVAALDDVSEKLGFF